jgi:hypothetical protein
VKADTDEIAKAIAELHNQPPNEKIIFAKRRMENDGDTDSNKRSKTEPSNSTIDQSVIPTVEPSNLLGELKAEIAAAISESLRSVIPLIRTSTVLPPSQQPQ